MTLKAKVSRSASPSTFMPPNVDSSSSFGCLQATLVTFGDNDVVDKCSLNPPPGCSE